MLFKGLGGIIIIISSTYLGFFYGNRLVKRVFQLKEIERLVLNIENQIVFTHTPFPEILKEISINKRNEIETLFYDIYKNMEKGDGENIHSYFKKSINNSKKLLCINQGDIDMVLNLALSLGDYDIEGYRKVFSLFKKEIEGKIKEAEELKIKNIKMYRYIGFSLGAMVVIMII